MVAIKAAVGMHFGGVAYAAGDTIDTSGLSDRAIASLLKHQPVYASASSSAVGSARFFYDQPPTVVANNLVFSQNDSDPDIGTGIGYDPATGLFAVAAGLVHVRVELSFAADTTGNGFATLRARNAGDTGSVAVGDAAQYQTPVGLPAGQILTLSDVLGVTAAGNVSVGWHQGTEAALDYCSVTVFTS